MYLPSTRRILQNLSQYFLVTSKQWGYDSIFSLTSLHSEVAERPATSLSVRYDDPAKWPHTGICFLGPRLIWKDFKHEQQLKRSFRRRTPLLTVWDEEQSGHKIFFSCLESYPRQGQNTKIGGWYHLNMFKYAPILKRSLHIIRLILTFSIL